MKERIQPGYDWTQVPFFDRKDLSLANSQPGKQGEPYGFSLRRSGLVVQDVTAFVTGASRDARGASARSTPRDARRALGTNDGICFHPSESGFSVADAPALSVDADTGELLDAHWGHRLKRWELQASARELLPESRLRVCYRHRQKQTDFVRVYRRGEGEKASTYYRGLQVCGSVWSCPVCASKITERKRQELVKVIEQHTKAGGGVMLLTLTVPHTREDRAFEVADGLLEAFRSFGMGRNAWTRLVPGYVGSVRSLEVTHTVNGWHPHLHVLVLTSRPLSDVQRFMLSDLLHTSWSSVTLRKGFAPLHRVHGLRLDDGKQAGSYAAKWGIPEELTKAHVKQGRREDSRTPWALLADYTLNGDHQAGALFREFAQAFKGKSQLHWSRGLKALFQLEEKTDEQLAEETHREEDVLAARIGPADWSLIRRHELRGLVLELLRSSDWSAVVRLLDHYRARGAAPGVVATKARKGTTPEESQTGPGRERVALSDGSAGPVPSFNVPDADGAALRSQSGGHSPC